MKSRTFFDMQDVEILRGPRGTAFGRNASSGLIHLKTARPQWDRGSGVAAELGSHQVYGVEAFATGALSKTAAGRFAMNFDNLGGYTEAVRTIPCFSPPKTMPGSSARRSASTTTARSTG